VREKLAINGPNDPIITKGLSDCRFPPKSCEKSKPGIQNSQENVNVIITNWVILVSDLSKWSNLLIIKSFQKVLRLLFFLLMLLLTNIFYDYGPYIIYYSKKKER